MSKDTDQSKSLIDEIYDEFLRSLKESGELDENLLEKLTPLIKKGEIRKYQQGFCHLVLIKYREYRVHYGFQVLGSSFFIVH